VEGPDIEKTIKGVGGKPTATKEDGSPQYTLPVIQDPNTSTAVSDSLEIAKYLDATYPETPSLLLGTPALHRGFIEALDTHVISTLLPLALGGFTPKLNKASADHWTAEEEHFAYPKGDRLPAVLKQLEDGLQKVSLWVEEGKVLFGGDRPVFVDAYLAGWLISLRWSHGKESSLWRDVEGWQNGRWKAFMEQIGSYEKA
jgi:glutathione S-transferase